jgi:NADPH:quinone reductase-like Zn-dependent oxidoreductase
MPVRGSLAIQLAKLAGAYVTGIDNAGKLDFLRSVGADDAVDYRSEDFTRRRPFDVILDLVAHRSVFAYRRALATSASADVCGRCWASSPWVPPPARSAGAAAAC